MNKSKIRDFLLGATLLGGLVGGGMAISKHSKNVKKDKEKAKTEIVSTPTQKPEQYDANDPYGNIAVFEGARNKIKFALAFVENYAPVAYDDGTGKWTVGYGLTILYNADGSSRSVKKGEKCTIEQADVYKDRYLTHDILPDIKKYIKVPMDENTMIATCVFRYCIGGKNFRKSQYLQQLNAGTRGEDLAKYLTGYRAQRGLMNRNYFFAALMSGYLEYDELLDLRAEGCYNLLSADMARWNTKSKRYIVDKDKLAMWDFSYLPEKLEKAKRTRRSKIGECKFVSEIIPEYVMQNLYNTPDSSSFVVQHQSEPQLTIDLPKAIHNMRDVAMEKYANKDYDGALAILQDLIKTGHQGMNLYNDISRVQYAAGHYRQALRSAQQAFKFAHSDKDMSDALYNQGMVHAARGYYKKAIDCYNQAKKFYRYQKIDDAIADAMIQHEQKGDRTDKKAFLVGIGVLAAGHAASKKRVWRQNKARR